MAEFVLSFVVEESLARVVSLITDEISLVLNLRNDLKELQKSLTMIRAVLHDAEEQQTQREPIRLWLKKLKQVAYDVEDLFDKLAYEDLRLKVDSEVRNFNPFSRVTRPAKMAYFNAKMAHKIKNVNESVSKIKNEAMGFGLQLSSSDKTVPNINLNQMTDSVLDSPVVGREADVTTILNLLGSCCNQQVLTIVPILGMGGIGKTFLAKLVCQEVKERKIFDVKIWICVSQNSSDQKILGEMLQCLCPNIGGLNNKDAIVSQLQNELERKKLLLVLDDVWDDVSNWWDDLKIRLLTIVKNSGSAVLVTTRQEDVVSTVESSSMYRHNLDGLTDKECWSIIKNRVLGDRETSIPAELESIGQDLARKCGGVPLAAKVLGGTLSGLKLEKEAWLSILNNEVLNVSYGKDKVEAILKLSFDHLSPYLKACFAFCSIFPKDHLIEKEDLIQLWMAEGFLEPCSGDVGAIHFNALVCNSLFQDLERDEYGNIQSCKMHDLVHDLAISLSRSEVLTFENYSSKFDLTCIRRVNLDGQYAMNSMAICAKKLRTIFLSKEVVFDKSWKLKNLRTLKLKGAAIEELPSQMDEWKSLRYLDVSETRLKAFPESISKLYNLQTLRFKKCMRLNELPGDRIKYLMNLKHLEFSMDWQMPGGLGRLTKLERLPLFVVDSNRGCSIQELECLNELRGELEIKNLWEVRDKEEAKKANVQGKKKIKALKLKWRTLDDDTVYGSNDDEQVLEGLQPHPNTERIKIDSYLAKTFPSWFLTMKVPNGSDSFTLLNNLVELKLHCCSCCEQLPSLGNLPNLRNLELSYMYHVKSIGSEFYGIDNGGGNFSGRRLFPALKLFKLQFLENLIEWKAPEEDDRVAAVFPCLEELQIGYCIGLTKIPTSHLSSLVKLDIDMCEELEYIFDEVQSFPRLKSLGIRGASLTCIPSALQFCTLLEELSIRKCECLSSIPEGLGKLKSLVSLEICPCYELKEFHWEIIASLTGLKRLKVGGFSTESEDLSYLNSIQHLSSLQELTIMRSNSISLPRQLQHLTSLKYLEIRCFYKLKVLPEWLGNLSSLEAILIVLCEDLVNLPSATAMKRLSKLTLLHICGCGRRWRRCVVARGSEWHKISHIPKIVIE